MEYAYELIPNWWVAHRKLDLVYACLSALRGWAAEWCADKEHQATVGIHARGKGFSIWFVGSVEQCEDLGRLVGEWQVAIEALGNLDATDVVA